MLGAMQARAAKKNPLAKLDPHYGVARVISKLGLSSRTQAVQWVRQGRVRVNGRLVGDPEFPVRLHVDRVTVDGRGEKPARMAIMLNKPRGLVTTTRDEQGRDTVYSCFAGASLPWLAPVGRLDKASEGLLLFSNEPSWAAKITDPKVGPHKTYHVQIDRIAESSLLQNLERGVHTQGEHLSAKSAQLLRSGTKNAWLKIVLEEGRNRQIRRLLEAFDVSVLRLVRVAIGPLLLGELPKGRWRALTDDEMKAFELDD
jgi:23S rRNA pseudouridine2605 synthase